MSTEWASSGERPPRIFPRRAAPVPARGYRHGAAGAAAVFGRPAASYDRVIPFFATFAVHLAGRSAIRPGDRVLDVACEVGACAAETIGAPVFVA